jgi:ribosome biogenesis GTPase A
MGWQVVKAAKQMSMAINQRREARGLKPRPIRACVIGFPNVGKSALINRMLNRRLCDSAPKPGVTRDLKWLRVGGDLDLLDAPGAGPSPSPCPGGFFLPWALSALVV